jgi:hypothetical protein
VEGGGNNNNNTNNNNRLQDSYNDGGSIFTFLFVITF